MTAPYLPVKTSSQSRAVRRRARSRKMAAKQGKITGSLAYDRGMPVHAYILVTEDTIEEKLLGTLAAKSELASAALDFDSELSEVTMSSGIEELKRRLEKLLGEKPIAVVDESMQIDVDQTLIATAERRDKVAAASGELLGAALNLVSQLLDRGQPVAPAMVNEMSKSLSTCVERDAQGRPQLKLTLANDEALQSLAKTLAQLLVQGK